MIELVKNTKIDFMVLKNYAFAFSAVLVILGIVGTVQIFRGKANLGIDLAGGTSIQVKFQKPFAMDEIRSLLAKAGHGEATLQEVSGENILLSSCAPRGRQEERMVAEPVVNLLRGNPSRATRSSWRAFRRSGRRSGTSCARTPSWRC